VAEGEPAEQVERDRGDPESSREAAEDAKSKQDRPDFGENCVPVPVHAPA
jgi:hypothetical protein